MRQEEERKRETRQRKVLKSTGDKTSWNVHLVGYTSILRRFQCLDCIAMDGTVIGKETVVAQSRRYPGIRLQEERKTTEIFSQNILCRGRDSIRVTYRIQVYSATARPSCSLNVIEGFTDFIEDDFSIYAKKLSLKI